ncbi:unnamed protein product [Mycena citricolor]|uniref:P-loop containing nucleoside triphosphate hydrolase protein n=1 Tax=Mycena citricolor TaxID=2018698 RepID=A0AAD2H9H7_9AGAR|nr:unnamed protein product [Mycena citricolor]
MSAVPCAWVWIWAGSSTLVVSLACLARLPLPPSITARTEIFRPFLKLEEAEAIVSCEEHRDTDGARDDNDDDDETKSHAATARRAWMLAAGGLAQALAWTLAGVLSLLPAYTPDAPPSAAVLLVAASWVYATARPMLRPPSVTAPYDLFALYVVYVCGGLGALGALFFQGQIQSRVVDMPPHQIPMPHPMLAVERSFPPLAWALSGSTLVAALLLVAVLRMPVGVPSTRVRKADIGVSVSPEDYTSLWGWIVFSWVYPMIRRGSHSTLDFNDVWKLSATNASRAIFWKFQQTPATSLLMKIARANALDLTIEFLGTLVCIALDFSNPYFLKRLLDLLDQPHLTRADRAFAYLYAGAIFGVWLLNAELSVQHLWYQRRASLRVRSELMAAIYDKTLRRKDRSSVTKSADGAKSAADTGKIMNMMSTDAEQMSAMTSLLFLLYGSPTRIVVGGIFLYQILGWSAFAGFVVFLASWPLNKFFSQRGTKISRARSQAADERMGLVSELVAAIKFVKFFAWETKWTAKVMAAREAELKWLAKLRLNSIMFTALFISVPISLSVASFCCYILLGNELTVSKAFTAIALFGMIRQPISTFPGFIVDLIQARVGLNRIADYLEEEEVSDQVSSLKRDVVVPSTGADGGLGLDRATLHWNGGSSDAQQRFALHDVSVVFPEGKLSVVTGPTASGKSALLMALMGEMTMVQGSLLLDKSGGADDDGLVRGVAYAAQTPWLQHRSIRDNILFGSAMDRARYDAAVRCCALDPDFAMLEDGDRTEIGVNGVSLSGGQKARVALARAVYSRKKYVLLDDPLSAVDSHTARFLYEQCLRGSLLAKRTVVLVTHHVHLVAPGADYLVRMRDGKVDSQGPVADLRARGLLDDIVELEQAVVAQEKVAQAAQEVKQGGRTEERKEPRKLVEDEKRESGRVKVSVYREYLSASGYHIWAAVVLLIAFKQMRIVGEKLWIKFWTEAYEDEPGVTALPSANEHPLFYIGVYTLIQVLWIVLQVSTVALQRTAALRASKVMFRRLLDKVVGATFRFHDTTPAGRILNRFSKDFTTIDTSLALMLGSVMETIAGLVFPVLTAAVIFPAYILPASLFALVYYFLVIGYVRTGRDLRRMESTTRSPIFSNFGELLQMGGLVTVRAFGAEGRYMDRLHAQVDLMTSVWYAFWMANRWLLFNSDLLSGCSVFAITLFSIATLENNAGLAGLAITSALNFTENVYWACRNWTGLELDLNSVERVLEYLDLPQEPSEGVRPPAYWPSSTSTNALVRVEDLEVRYSRELPAVLTGVSFELRAGERIGLVGRTGSGKSTLAMSLLRFVDPAAGRIVVDGRDIASVGVQDLRSRIVFIPQDATLFSGTLRDNLDPFGDFDDAACRGALRSVQLGAQLALDSEVSAGGANLSQGQRQLVAIARALLRRAAIVVMDEATSSVDFETDARIQESVRTGFGGALVITVAHRLKTVVDYDRVVVLDRGRVVEIGAPLELMMSDGGLFRSMCVQSGKFEELESLARGKA